MDQTFNESVTYKLFGKDDAILARYSPSSYLKEKQKDVLLLTGQDDYPYIRRQADVASVKLDPQTSDSLLIQGYTHEDMVLKVLSGSDDVSDRIVEFIQKRKKKRDSPLSPPENTLRRMIG